MRAPGEDSGSTARLQRFSAAMFLLASVMFLVGGLLPLLPIGDDDEPNTMFLVLSPVFLALGAAQLATVKRASLKPGDDADLRDPK